MPTHFASVQRNAKNFASVVITLRNKGLFGSPDFWHGVCIKLGKHTRYQKVRTMFFKTKRNARKTTRQTLSTEQLEPKAMFSVSPVEPVVALDVGPVNQAGYDCTNAGACSADGFMKIGDIKGSKANEGIGNDGRRSCIQVLTLGLTVILLRPRTRMKHRSTLVTTVAALCIQVSTLVTTVVDRASKF